MTGYLLKSSLALAVAYILFALFARRNTSFIWLRAYFLAVILLALILPALQFVPQMHRQPLVEVSAKYVPMWINDISSLEIKDISNHTSLIQHENGIIWEDAIKYLYQTGCIVFLIRFLVGFCQISYLLLRNKSRQEQGCRLVLVPGLPAPFSFFHLIFIDPKQYEHSQFRAMLLHEHVHVRQWHSVDLLLLEVITVLQWFNPFVWFVRRNLKEIHEFLADDGTVQKDISPLDYQRLLLSQASVSTIYLPTNGFKSSLTKKRILMITNNKRNKRWFTVFLLLVFAGFLIDSFSRTSIVRTAANKVLSDVNKGIPVSSPTKVNHANRLLGLMDTLSINVHDKNSNFQAFTDSDYIAPSHKKIAYDTTGRQYTIIKNGLPSIKEGSITYGFIGEAVPQIAKDIKVTDTLLVERRLKGGGVLGNFKEDGVLVAYNSFNSESLELVYPKGYMASKEVLQFLKTAMDDKRITDIVKKNKGAHFQVGVKITKTGKVLGTFLSTSSDSKELDIEFVNLLKSIPPIALLEKDKMPVSGNIVFLFAMYCQE